MKIGIIKEYKNPPDKRVVFSPSMCLETKKRYPLRSHNVLCSFTLENNKSPKPIANKTSNKNFKFINPQKFTLKTKLI